MRKEMTIEIMNKSILTRQFREDPSMPTLATISLFLTIRTLNDDLCITFKGGKHLPHARTLHH